MMMQGYAGESFSAGFRLQAEPGTSLVASQSWRDHCIKLQSVFCCTFRPYYQGVLRLAPERLYSIAALMTEVMKTMVAETTASYVCLSSASRYQRFRTDQDF
jgi:hypothetical protein